MLMRVQKCKQGLRGMVVSDEWRHYPCTSEDVGVEAAGIILDGSLLGSGPGRAAADEATVLRADGRWTNNMR